MTPRSVRLVAAALCLTFYACGGTSTPAPHADAGPSDAGPTDAAPTDGGPADDGAVLPVPTLHRPVAVECSHDRGPGSPEPGLTGAECAVDADCTAGNNGRCNGSRGGALTNYCSYDACFTDGECTLSEACRCRESTGDANVCVAGNCLLDGDCGAGGYCSPSRGFDRINLGVDGFWCHTRADECVDDEDCAVDGGSDARCTWFPARLHWACSTMGFFPP